MNTARIDRACRLLLKGHIMIKEELIELAKEEAEKMLDEYVYPYIIEIIKSIIDDKCTDSRMKDTETNFTIAGYTGEFIMDYMMDYVCKENFNPKFVKKSITRKELVNIVNRIVGILVGDKDGKLTPVY